MTTETTTRRGAGRGVGGDAVRDERSIAVLVDRARADGPKLAGEGRLRQQRSRSGRSNRTRTERPPITWATTNTTKPVEAPAIPVTAARSRSYSLTSARSRFDNESLWDWAGVEDAAGCCRNGPWRQWHTPDVRDRTRRRLLLLGSLSETQPSLGEPSSTRPWRALWPAQVRSEEYSRSVNTLCLR